MYNRLGKSANEEVHRVEKMIIHPEYVCTLKIFTIKFQLNALCFFSVMITIIYIEKT